MIQRSQFIQSLFQIHVIILFVSISLTIFFVSSIEDAIASDHVLEIYSKDKKSTNNDDTLIVKSKIHLENIEKIGFLRIVGFINAQEFSQDVPLSTISSSSSSSSPDKLIVKFIVDKENEFVQADSPDEFFICAYHIKNPYSDTIDEIDGYTIKRTFEFDRNTDIGIIQLGDKFHGCVSSEDLRPPEGTECEKRLIKSLKKTNKLLVR